MTHTVRIHLQASVAGSIGDKGTIMPKTKTVRPVGYVVEYEYAGFEYRITKTGQGWEAVPLPGQHHAASKPKHVAAAVECYLQDYNEA